MLQIYVYQKCGTCREAMKWLDARGIVYQINAIRETPPTVAELNSALAASGGDLKKLFNISGTDYRDLGMKDKLPGMSVDEALDLLSTHGNLVKRPFLIGEGKVLVGFNQDAWEKALGG